MTFATVRSRGTGEGDGEKSTMTFALKCFLGLFIFFGIGVAIYALDELWQTSGFVKAAPEKAKAVFLGYDRELTKTTNSSPSPTNPGQQDFSESWSVMSYPVYSYIGADGRRREHREPKAHIIEAFKAGQEVDIIVSSSGYPRLAGFYSLYTRDLVILALGLCFILAPLLIGRVIIPGLETEAGASMAARMKGIFEHILSLSVGPITVAGLMKGIGVFIALIVIVAIIQGTMPFLRQLGLGSGSKLITALEEKRYDDARMLILKGKDINRINQYNESALLLALQAGRADLGRMLIEAGAHVNVKSKMLMTPLRVSTQAGDLEMVKLLLAKGASPDTPEDETPPVAHALLKGRDDIARALIEGGTNLRRRYMIGERTITVGDMAFLARKYDLAEMIRQRGGLFTIEADATDR